jgi:glycosyltransferase involved in cell wall biosynthesis
MSKFQNAARSAGKLIVLTSHPIQYQAPLWREMAKALHFDRGHFDNLKDDGRGGPVPFEVWFLTDQGVRRTEDKDFGKAFAWDVDLLSGYPHRFLELSGAWDIKKFNGVPLAEPIGKSLREAGASAVWIEGWRLKPFWDAAFSAKKSGLKVLLRAETSDKIRERRGIFGWFRRQALRRLFSRVDGFLVIGQACRRFYLSYGVSPAKMLETPYGVDNEFFRAEAGKIRGTRHEARGEGGAQGAHFDGDNFEILTEQQKQIRREWNIPLDAKVVMFCGKFVRKKRPLDVALAARAHFDSDNFDNLKGEKRSPQKWHLLFVGSGELGDKLRAACDVVYDAECQNAKISKSQNAGGPPATFAGFLNQSEISKAYAVADVMVLPSEAWETWGLVVNEATAAGVPTVIGDQCGCADDFGRVNPYSRVFPTGDVEALAKCVDEVLALPADPSKVSRVADQFSLSKTAKAVHRWLSADIPGGASAAG